MTIIMIVTIISKFNFIEKLVKKKLLQCNVQVRCELNLFGRIDRSS